MLSGEAACVPPAMGMTTYVDVPDAVMVRLWCMAHAAQSDGQLYTVSGCLGPPQGLSGPGGVIPKGEPGKGYRPDAGFARGGERCGGTKAVEAIGALRYTCYDKSILDTAKVMEG